MPYDNDDDVHIDSVADTTTDIITPGEIGGIGQLQYHTFSFADYDTETTDSGQWLLKPIVYKDKLPKIEKKGVHSGKDILVALLNLAKSIDREANGQPYYQQIIDFCTTYCHPYKMDYIYSIITDEKFDVMFDGRHLEKDAAFSIGEFMHDLGNLYTAGEYYFVLRELYENSGDPAYDFYGNGRFFERLALFERFKNGTVFDAVDYTSDSISTDDLIAEMKKDSSVPADESKDYIIRPGDDEKTIARKKGDFEMLALEYYDQLADKFVDMMPDFHLRLKRSPRTNRFILAADVHSVFDIAWYTLGRMVAQFDSRTPHGNKLSTENGVVVNCVNCGRAFFRTCNRQEYCGRPECKNARNRRRQKRYRENKKARERKNK